MVNVFAWVAFGETSWVGILAGLRMAEVMVEATEKLVHDLDWCLSGDTSPDTLKEEIAAWRRRFAPRLRRALAPRSRSEKAKPTTTKKPRKKVARRSL